MRAVPIDGIHALFDLTGETLGDGTVIPPGRLLRSGFTEPLSPAAARDLRAYGLTSVIDLRSPREVAKAPGILLETPGVRHSLVSVGDDASAPRPENWHALSEMYLRLAEEHGAGIRKVVQFVAQRGDGGTLVHCTTGRDRTGLVVAIILRALGVPDDVIVTRHRRVSGAVAGYVALRRLRWLAKGRDPAHFEALHRGSDEALVQVFQWMDERFGGAGPYLEAQGEGGDLVAGLHASFASLKEDSAYALDASVRVAGEGHAH